MKEQKSLPKEQFGLFPCQLRSFMDNKVNTNRIAEKAELPSVPYVLTKSKQL